MRVKPKIFGLWQGICLVLIFASLAFAASYRNTVSLAVSGAARSLLVTNATDGSTFNATVGNDTVNLNTGLNFFKTDNVLTLSVTNNYSQKADIYILTTIGNSAADWLVNNCTLGNSSSCQVEFKELASFGTDDNITQFANATYSFATLLPRSSITVFSFPVTEDFHVNEPVVFWAFSFIKGSDNATHLIGMDTKTVFINPDFGNISYY